jgi:hypothetical protein
LYFAARTHPAWAGKVEGFKLSRNPAQIDSGSGPRRIPAASKPPIRSAVDLRSANPIPADLEVFPPLPNHGSWHRFPDRDGGSSLAASVGTGGRDRR